MKADSVKSRLMSPGRCCGIEETIFFIYAMDLRRNLCESNASAASLSLNSLTLMPFTRHVVIPH
jgi:hypothetical protein